MLLYTVKKIFYFIFYIVYSPPRPGFLLHYLYSITVRSTPPQTTTLGRPPQAEIRTRDRRSRGWDSASWKILQILHKVMLFEIILISKLRFFFGLRGRFPSLPWDCLHYSLCSCSASVYHCGRCRIRTQDLCPGFEPGTNEPPHLKITPTNHGKILVPKVMYSM